VSSRIKPHLESWRENLADWFLALWPRKKPSSAQLSACRIISHRGEHDNYNVMENTLAAFDAADRTGVWGIECDVRWTADLEPVICHDPDLKRIFGRPSRLNEMTFLQLRDRFPQVPSLSDVVDRYGGRRHLMIELKEEIYSKPEYQGRKLSQILASITPQKDYHLLSFDPGIFDRLGIEPADVFIPIARFNARELSRQSIKKGYAGLSGHCLLVRRQHLDRHRHRGQKTGTGFINSTNCLFREVNRRVDWLFSDCAAKMQRVVDHLKSLKAGPDRRGLYLRRQNKGARTRG